MIGLGIIVATVAAFLISFVFYAVVPVPGADSSGRPRWWQIAIEIVRSTVVAALVAGLMVAADWHGAVAGALLGLALAVLPIVLLAGSVLWERVPVRAATTHVADWVIKLAAVGAIVGAFV